VQAWHGSRKMKNNEKIQELQFAVNNEHKGSSAWIRLANENVEAE